MCTLVVMHRVFAKAPLIVAANRDERLDRPAESPAWRRGQGMPVFCPTDLEAGGTWIGLNAEGVFAGITNRFGPLPIEGRASRGELVLRALEAGTAKQAAEKMTATSAEFYNGFHLVIADREHAFSVWGDGVTLHSETLGAGMHVFSERSYGAADSHRERWLKEALKNMEADRVPTDRELKHLLATHQEPTFEGTCIHWAEKEYGTRSATLLTLGADPAELRFQYCPTPPCSGQWVDCTGDFLAGA